ncbi:MAG TPA: hypothetical protein VM490_06735 [Armatimonadaceae bacterium]|nr:hypothetical protein [Armatimonadaceae bacterium]
MDEKGLLLLQFGAGNFLRAFADLFVQEMNEGTQRVPGRVPLGIVVVQSTDGERARLLTEAGGKYHVVVRGMENGRKVDRVQRVESIQAAYTASGEWPEVVETARDPRLVGILSNTTEAGLVLDDADAARPPADTSVAPRSFPARLLVLLKARYEVAQQAVLLLPCELFERNGDRLKELVLEQAHLWGWDADQQFLRYLRDDCSWPNSLVDRIVSGRPAGHPLLAEDPLLTVAEPFAFWALEDKPGTHVFSGHPSILRVPDIMPYALRKVRILNGAHTGLVAYTRKHHPEVKLVREALAVPSIREWLHGLLFEEIVPTVRDRVPDAEAFANQTLERFSNPFLDHHLSDIALHHDKKVPVRLVSTRDEYVARFGKTPARLTEAIEA